MYISIEKVDNGYVVRKSDRNPYGPGQEEVMVYGKLSDVVKYITAALEPKQTPEE